MNARRILIVLIVSFVACLAGVSWAQESGQAGGEPAESESIFTIYVLKGGGFNFLIIALSITTVAFIIEHAVTLQRDKQARPEVIVELEQLLDEEQYEEAMNLCEANRNYVSNVVSAALARVGEGFETMSSAMEIAIEEENMRLSQKISYLNLFGNLGPLMGLFGTVYGMIEAFTMIASRNDTPPPAELAKGIYTALVTTVWGLLVAMPALTAYFVFKNKVQKLSFELASVSAELLDRVIKRAPKG